MFFLSTFKHLSPQVIVELMTSTNHYMLSADSITKIYFMLL